MKRLFLPAGLALVFAGVFVAAQEKSKPAPPSTTKTPPAKAAPAKTAPAKTEAAKTAPGAEPNRSAEEDAVRQTGEALVKTYNGRDGKAFAAAFTVDGEYVDEKGFIFHGRKAIEEEFTRFFAANPETTIDVALQSARVVAPGVMTADGATRFVRARGEPAAPGRCALVCAKDGGKWLIASLREIATADEHSSHHEKLKALEWLVGEWIDEGPDSHVHFSCAWDESGNFLVRDFAVHVAGQKVITGTQRIGYDPPTGHLKTWIFDSSGGYADGYWHREGEHWVVQSSGVTADGRMASGTSIFTPIDNHRMTWHTVDRVIGGERVPDVEDVTVVRKPPAPKAPAK